MCVGQRRNVQCCAGAVCFLASSRSFPAAVVKRTCCQGQWKWAGEQAKDCLYYNGFHRWTSNCFQYTTTPKAHNWLQKKLHKLHNSNRNGSLIPWLRHDKAAWCDISLRKGSSQGCWHLVSHLQPPALLGGGPRWRSPEVSGTKAAHSTPSWSKRRLSLLSLRCPLITRASRRLGLRCFLKCRLR